MISAKSLFPGTRSILDQGRKSSKLSKAEYKNVRRRTNDDARMSAQCRPSDCGRKSKRCRINDGHPCSEVEFLVITGGYVDTTPSQPLATRPFTLTRTANGNVQVGINSAALPLPTIADLLNIFGVDPDLDCDRTQWVAISGLTDANELLFNTIYGVVGLPSPTSPVIILEPIDFVSRCREYSLGRGSKLGLWAGQSSGLYTITDIDCVNLTLSLQSTGTKIPFYVQQIFVDNDYDDCDDDDYSSDCSSDSSSSDDC